MTTLLIDGNGMAYQSFYATGGLSDDGNNSGAIFGTLSYCLSLGHKFKTNRFVFCWDSPKSFRRDDHPEYKRQRRNVEGKAAARRASVARQILDLKLHVLPEIGWTNQIEQDGIEADDLIAKHVEERSIIVSSDEDMFQCLVDDSEWPKMWSQSTRTLWDGVSFEKVKGIPPSRWVDVKMIAGCSSDEVKGIRGIGEGSVVSWIKGELITEGRLKKIEEQAEEMKDRNRALVSLPHDRTTRRRLAEDKLSIKGLIRVAESFGMMSFVEGEGKKRWERLFDGEFDGSRYNSKKSDIKSVSSAKDKMKRRRRSRR